MENKLPDSFVVDRFQKTYPTEIGSQNFTPDDLEIFKSEKSQSLKKYYSAKFDEIKSEWENLISEMKLNERLYLAKCSFTPTPGGTYYLYKRESGEEFLSIISPEQWNRFQFIGKFKFGTDGRWLNI